MSHSQSQRPWYRDKRFIIPVALIATVNIIANVAAVVRSNRRRRQAQGGVEVGDRHAGAPRTMGWRPAPRPAGWGVGRIGTGSSKVERVAFSLLEPSCG
jgi:hypothetical protein